MNAINQLKKVESIEFEISIVTKKVNIQLRKKSLKVFCKF
jgi:hypothetical protein